MKTKRSLSGLMSLIMSLLIGIPLSAQVAGSAGCSDWNNLPTQNLIITGTFSMNNRVFDSGDIVEATFTLNTATTATVTLETPLNTVRDTATFISGSSTLSYTIPVDATYTLVVRNTATSDGTVDVSFSCTPAPIVPPVVAPPVVSSATGSVTNTMIEPVVVGFTDDRINYLDAAAPIAIYSYVDDRGRGFVIYHADGRFAYRATASDLQNLPLYDSVNNIRISSIAGGGYEITAPQYNNKTYIMQVDAPYAHIGYTSWEQE